ncbi:hypothetical protein A3Q56_01803 [Intoshia linei]|uniref:Uncharacterized protein n=1 Tax=Intoshia linei TaxID=1819745 RepID=A0A177B866_9BILA|nr:hypothetical protein A3Q56_01803 [Intoshia linei]
MGLVLDSKRGLIDHGDLLQAIVDLKCTLKSISSMIMKKDSQECQCYRQK